MNCGTNCGCSTTGQSAQTSGQTSGQSDVRPSAPTSQVGPAYRPVANVVESAEKYQITLEVPGSSSDGIDVQVHEGVLSVTARVAPREAGGGRAILREFGVGDYARQFRVGEDIDAGAISAAYASGVLTIDLPKSRKAEGRRVPVTAN